MIFCMPKTTSRQNPKDGIYMILSANTNPTRKNRLEAGKNDMTATAKAMFTTLNIRSHFHVIEAYKQCKILDTTLLWREK